MSTTLYLTVDLHAHRWFDSQADDAAIWLCIQPHIRIQRRQVFPYIIRRMDVISRVDVKFADLRAFIENHATGGRFKYLLLPEEVKDSEFVPVNLPSDVEITVQWDTDGPMRQPNRNTRSTGMHIIDPTCFNNDNRGGQAADTAGQDKAQPVEAGPFAAAYNQALQGALQAITRDPNTDLSDLADQLILGFWGGTRRRIRARSVTPGDIELMALDTGDLADDAEVKQDPTFRVTNLHSLNGLMFKVLERSQVPEIGTVRDLTIRLSWPGGGTVLKVSEAAAEALERLQTFFETLGDVPAEVLSDLKHREAPGFANRVYVDDQMIGFGAVQLGTGDGGAKQTWFRRRAERRADPELQSRLADMSRLVVHFGRPMESTAQDSNLPPVEGPMTFEVADVVECRLTRYRLGGATEPGAWLVARLSPTETDRAQFERELEADEDCFRNKPLLDQNGDVLPATQVRYLGCYQFPWEGDERVPLFLVKSMPASGGEGDSGVTDDVGEGDSGVIGELETVSVVFPRVEPDGKPIRLTLDPAGSRTKEEGMRDPTGPRWELPADPQLPDAEFELLRLVEPALSPEHQARLIVAVAFRDDAEFVFAHSAARYEGVIRVDYPEIEGEEAEQEIREDLVNFNTLNVYHRWPILDRALSEVDDSEDRRELNTRFSELFPFWSEDGGHSEDGDSHAGSVAFQYLFKQPVQSPPGDLAGADIRRYFDALYQAAGTQRRLDFRLEHTYGSELDLGKDSSLACPLDIRPLLPPHAASPRFKEETVKEVDAPPFFSVGYRKAAAGELLTLTFDRRYLDPALAPARTPDDDKRVSELREAYVNAQRALCELAYAEKIELEGRFLTFDFRQALHSDSGPIIAGLTPVPAFEGDATGWPVHLNDPSLPPEQNLQSVARALLDGWDTAPDRIEIPLPVGKHPSISDSCNVIELALRVTRNPDKVPAKDPTRWSVVRTRVRPTQPEWTGPQLEPAVGTDQGFRQFLNGLHRGRAAIQPDQETREASGRLLGLLSDGSAESAGAWIVPEGLKRLGGQSIMASITPLSFVPVKPHPQLGPQTFELAKRYLKGLQMILSLAPGAWTPKGEDDQVVTAWTDLLDRLKRYDKNKAIVNMAERIRDLLRPVHLAKGGPDDQALDEEVRKAIQDLTDPDTDPAREVQEKVRTATLSLLLRDLSLFGEAKALLYTRLRDGDSQLEITPAFHAWETLRRSGKYRKTPSPAGRGVGERGSKGEDRYLLQDQRRLSYRDGLTDLAGQYGYGFLEVLPDAGYGNDFTLEDAQALSFESLIEPFERGQNPITKRDPSIPLKGDRVRMPDQDKDAKSVFLPSRQPIRDPALASAAIFDEIQNNPNWSEEIRDDTKSFDLQKLLGGELVAVTEGPRVSVRAATTDPADQSQALDDFLVTGIFQVWSDEEDGFSKDTFDLWIEDADEGETIEMKSSVPTVSLSETFLKQLFKLSDSPQIQGIQDLDQLLNHVDEAGSLLEPVSDPGGEAWDTEPSLRLVVDTVNNGETLRRIDITSDPDSYLEAFLFRVLPIEPDVPPRPRAHYLLVAVERPIWRRTAIRLGQSRNRKDIEGPDFAPIFGFTSRSRTSAVPQQYTASVPDVGRELKLPARVVTWRQIETALVDQEFLLPSSLRQQHLVVVSVFHEQRSQLRKGYFDPSGKEKSKELASEVLSKFALEIVNVKPSEADSTQVRFPEPFEHFLLDLQWFSSRNRELLRLNGIRVALD
ncbi:hypothetical protein [Candidatus Thiosymbion oneisti]|uniref:hypothetical protein n=1 Tax=Candidatus Thiosymbion oneisti TaxID=589554 RepID=UPI00105B678A|nr:hypothetical protein [Candidatus Thiosymbion oneisti]